MWAEMVHTRARDLAHTNQLDVSPRRRPEGSAGVIEGSVGGRDPGHGGVRMANEALHINEHI